MKLELSKVFSILVSVVLVFTLRTAQAQYCVYNLYSHGCQYGDYIDTVSVGSINQMGTGCGPNSYSDYSNLTGTFEQGSTYTLNVTTANYGDYVSMWIDFNDDYNFADSEKVVIDLYCSFPFIHYSAAFDISPLAPLGNHRMRLRAVQYTVGFDACGTYFFGEVHDYTAEIVPVTDMAYVSSTTTQTDTVPVSLGSTDVEMIGIQVLTSGSLNPLSLTSFTLNSNGSTDFVSDVANVKVYYSGTDPAFSTANLFGSSANLSTPITGTQELSQGVNYFWIAYDISANASLNDYLDVECTSLTVGGTGYPPTITAPAGNRQIGYCLPVDVYSCYFAFIDGVELNTLSNILTYCIGNVNGYISYAPNGNLTTTLQQGSSYSISLTGPQYSMEGFGVWIDFDNDGDFNAADEFVYSSPTFGSGLQTGYLTIPSGADPGDHRMRVRCNSFDTVSSTEACTQFDYGETEDYMITVAQQLCSSNFTLYPDSLIPHHYWAVNLSWGVPPLNYLWNWGDSTYDTIAYPSHIYAAAGFYTICLTIQDSVGCSSMYCNTYNIQKMSSAEAENTIIKIDVVDSIPTIPTTVQNSTVLQSWSVFPNPASGNIFVDHSLSTPAIVSIEIDDVLGNNLHQIANDQPAGESHSIIDVGNLPNGIYLLRIHAGDQVVSQKIVVMK